VVLIVVLMPLYAMAYGTWEVLLPGWVLALAMPATAFQVPLWAFYRRMDYVRQRRLQLFDPVVGIVVTLALAVAGLGYWALVVGAVCGAWAAALVAVRASPYKLALRYERGTVSEYARFSGPLLFQGACVAVMSLTPVLVAQRALGTAAVGAMAIANNISVYTTKVDDVVTSTIYPAICAVKDRRDLLQEAFLKSNRMGLLWAAPTGIGIALFAPDLVHFALGARWISAIPVIQAFGLAAAINQIGFNWSAFFRALGDTRPIAVAGAVMALAVTGVAVPLLLIQGLEGYAIGMGISATCLVAARLVYLRRLFAFRPIAINVARGVLPALVGLAASGVARLALWGGGRTGLHAVFEMALFAGTVAAVTLLLEHGLLTEFRGYLRRPSRAAQQAG
jgi:O-antigen/teichoic acid export membrane protein